MSKQLSLNGIELASVSAANISPMNINEARFDRFREAHKIYRHEFYRPNPDHTEPYLCALHDAFGTANTTSHIGIVVPDSELLSRK